MATSTIVELKHAYDLPTQQKRLRHLRSLGVRNLNSRTYTSKDVSKVYTYFTLHKDTQSKAFYTSEKIVGSLNPTWQSFDIRRYEHEVNTMEKFIVVRVWVGQHDRKYRLLLDYQVNLSGLVFFADKLQQDGVKYSPNTVIFGMFDKYFVVPATDDKSSPNENTVPADISSRQLKVGSLQLKNSYTTNSLSRVYTVLRAIKQIQASVSKVHGSIEDRLLQSQERAEKLSKREELLVRVSHLKSELEWQVNKLQQEKDVYDSERKSSQNRENQLGNCLKQLGQDNEDLETKRKNYIQTREMYIKENAQLWMRRKHLIGELIHYIYPITEDSKGQSYICGVRLPQSEEFQGQDELMLAVALGYTSHLIYVISNFLNQPLRYPIEYRVSRSQIRDHIHTKLSNTDRDFPLYSKGKEKFKFNYGVFLLNKNISQLRYYCGLGTTDLRTTLPNIKALLEIRLGVKFDHPQRPFLISPNQHLTIQGPVQTSDNSSNSGGHSSIPSISDISERERTEYNRDQSQGDMLPSYGGKDHGGDERDHSEKGVLSGYNERTGGIQNGDVIAESQPVQIVNPLHKMDEAEDLFRSGNDHFFKSSSISDFLSSVSNPSSIQEGVDIGAMIEASREEQVDTGSIISKTSSALESDTVNDIDLSGEKEDFVDGCDRNFTNHDSTHIPHSHSD